MGTGILEKGTGIFKFGTEENEKTPVPKTYSSARYSTGFTGCPSFRISK